MPPGRSLISRTAVFGDSGDGTLSSIARRVFRRRGLSRGSGYICGADGKGLVEILGMNHFSRASRARMSAFLPNSWNASISKLALLLLIGHALDAFLDLRCLPTPIDFGEIQSHCEFFRFPKAIRAPRH